MDEPILVIKKSYEHQHFGPYINLISVLPGYPIAWVAWAKLYLYHKDPASALAQWMQFNPHKVTSRTIFATQRGSQGTIKTPEQIAIKLIQAMGQKSRPHINKYNHVILPDFDQKEPPHHYTKQDREVVKEIHGIARAFWGKKIHDGQMHFYNQPIDHDTDPDTIPISKTNKDWYAWRLMFNFLETLKWPMSNGYTIAKEEGWKIFDSPFNANLWDED